MNRLWVRITLAFTGVILMAVLILLGVSFVLTQSGVIHYVAMQELRQPGGVFDQLVQFYEQNRTWDGVGNFLFQHVGQDRLLVHDLQLLDASGQEVLAPRSMPLPPPEAITNPLPIFVEGATRGYIVVTSPRPLNDNFFLQGLSRALLTFAALIGVLGTVFAVVLSRSVTSPLTHLAAAAKAIGARDLSHRVKVQGSQEVIQLAHSFNEMAEHLEQAEHLRRNLLSDVAHELRTPLSVLQGNLRAILDDVYPLEKDEMARLYEQTRLLSRLVNDLHELAQAEARQLPLVRRPASPGDIISDMLQVFEPLADAEAITVTAAVQPDLPQIEVDTARFKQVLHNLIANAIQHTPEDGAIALRAARIEDHVEISVSDTGSGIAPEHLPHVFDRFYRADQNRSRDSGGTGLGLAIAKAIVEAHNGTISVASQLGKGTTFVIRLPALSATTETAPAN